MADFARAFEHLMEVEAGNDPNGGLVVDSGGITKWGFTLPTLRRLGDLDMDGYQDGDVDRDGDVDADDIRRMPRELAEVGTVRLYWDAFGYGQIESCKVATKILDMSFNFGDYWGHMMVQRVLNCINPKAGLAEDGQFGANTLAAVNRCPECILIPALRIAAVWRYYELARVNPAKYGAYLKGWRRRALSI